MNRLTRTLHLLAWLILGPMTIAAVIAIGTAIVISNYFAASGGAS